VSIKYPTILSGFLGVTMTKIVKNSINFQDAPVLVCPIPTKEAEPWIIERHYAKRMCPITYAFGIYRGVNLIGVVTYGTPVSSTLRVGVCGEEWADSVLELNRLCCENSKNTASMLVGRSLQMLPKPSIVVSYADTAQGHVGYIYQATNFIYTGLSAKRTDWKIKGREHLHSATIADESRGKENRANWMREKYGDNFYLEDRPRKHRYIFAVGNKKQRSKIMKALKYKIESYPKGESQRYEITKPINTQSVLFLD
jgi:hypothetical protein